MPIGLTHTLRRMAKLFGLAAATFTAVAPGHATIVAARTSCGEAMLCQGSAGHYQIEVVVAS